MFRKLFTLIVAASLTLGIAGGAFAATFEDLKLLRVYYERTTGTVELATDLGNVETLIDSPPASSIAGSFGTVEKPENLHVVYFAIDRVANKLWVSGSISTEPVAVGTLGFNTAKSGANSMFTYYNVGLGGTQTVTGQQSYSNSYRNKLSASQGAISNAINTATRPYTEAKLESLLKGTAASVSQPLYFFSNANTTGSKGVALATITTNADGSTVISAVKKIQRITLGAMPTVAVGGTGTILATADSGLAVTITSATPDVCTIDGTTVTGVSAGLCTIAANQAGDAVYYPAGEVRNSFAVEGSPVNGVCGISDGKVSNVAPTENLCSAGTASEVSGTGPWTWSCTGSNGGSTANCSSSNVARASQTITFNPPSTMTYGDASVNLGNFASGGQSGNPVTFEIVGTGPGSLGGDNNATLTITGAGTITIKASQAGNAAYDAAPDVQKEIAVSPKALTITADGKTKVYGDSDPALTYTANGLVPGDTLTGVLARAAGENAGDYAISQGTLAASANYTITFTGANFTITPAPLTVIANNASRPVGAVNPVDPGFTAPDLVGTDSITGVTYTYAATATPTAIVGSTHAITPSAAVFGSGAASNYAITYVDGTLTITGTTPQTISFSPPESVTYGDPPITLAATASPSGLPVTFTIVSGPAKLNGNQLSITGARMVTVKASQAGNTTYAAAPDIVKTITVSPKALTIKANETSRAYGDANPANPGFAAPGLAGTDSIISVTYTYASTATSTASVTSTHAITPSAAVFGSGSAANYEITYVAGTLTIEKGTQTISFSPLATVIYGNPPITLGATGGRSGNPVTFSASGPATLNGSQLTITGAGTITVKASQAGNANYVAAPDVEKTITVSPKALTITAKNASRAYGDQNPANPGFTASGLVGTDSITGLTYVYASTATSTADVGSTHSITPDAAQFGPGAAGNYTITYKPGTLSISKAGQTIGAITLSAQTLTVNGSVTAGATATSGLPVTFISKTPDICKSVSGSAVITGLKAGTCTIAADQPGDANYNAAPTVTQDIATAFAPITFTVTAAVDSSRNNGSITPVPPAPLVSPGDKASFTLNPNQGYQIGTITGTCPKGILNGTTYTTGAINTDCAINATFVATQKKGDLDGNLNVDIADALIALRITVGLVMATPEQIAAAPAGSISGKIDIRDAVAILQITVGL